MCKDDVHCCYGRVQMRILTGWKLWLYMRKLVVELLISTYG